MYLDWPGPWPGHQHSQPISPTRRFHLRLRASEGLHGGERTPWTARQIQLHTGSFFGLEPHQCTTAVVEAEPL